MFNLNKNQFGGMVTIGGDCFAGSGSKGSLFAWLADCFNFNLATNNWGSNAGHYVEFDNGLRILNQHVPSSYINKNTELYINAGAIIDIKILMDEIKIIESHGFEIKSRLTIHPHANVITKEDMEYEKSVLTSGSTFKGVGSATIGKVLRKPNQKLAKDYDELAPFIKDRTFEINEKLAKGMKILVEGSQGIDLDLNFAEFPYTTSRQTHATQLLADCGLAPQTCTNVIMNIRTNPIRINNVSAADGTHKYTGNYWDAKEISWQDIAARAGYDNYDEFEKEYGFALLTSVTRKLRRVFEFPKERMKFVHAISGGLLPDSHLLYSLNFVNFIDRNVKGVKTVEEVMTPKIVKWLNENIKPTIGFDKLKLIRTGPKHSEVVVVNEDDLVKHCCF